MQKPKDCRPQVCKPALWLQKANDSQVSEYHLLDDGFQKRFYSNRVLVEDLVKRYLPEKLVCELDFSQMERFRSSFVTHNMSLRHGDCIWRIHSKKGLWIYLFLMLEFQSRPDKWMAIRMANYTLLLWLDLIKDGVIRNYKDIPPVYPLVLYNGRRKWRAVRSMDEIIAHVPEQLRKFLPVGGKYHLLAVNELDKKKLDQENFVSSIILGLDRIENGKDVINSHSRCLQLNTPEMSDLFSAAIEYICQKAKARNINIDPEEIKSPERGDTMLAENLLIWEKKLVADGETRGEARGEAKGIIATCLDFGISKVDIINKLVTKMQCSSEEAEKMFRDYAVDNKNVIPY